MLLDLTWNDLGDWFGDHGAAILGTIVVASLVAWFLRRIVPGALRPAITRQMADRPEVEVERRVDTLSSVIVRTAQFILLLLAFITILPELGMADGRFVVHLEPVTPPGASGAEEVEFRVALNVGHEMRPLARVASGGELSRVMLALKTILARLDRIPTLVFDEVDSGIGGKVGLQVGEMLRRVAASHQVFAITHLPQIASRAHTHILVAKGARAGVTAADVTTLADRPRVTEIARMLGGDPDSATSRAHAEELLAEAAKARRVPR